MLHQKSELNKYAIFDLDAGFVSFRLWNEFILPWFGLPTHWFHIASENWFCNTTSSIV